MSTYQLPAVTVSPAPAAPRPSLMSLAVTPMTSTPTVGPVLITTVPLEVDLDLYKGDDWFLDLIVTNPDGSDADLSNATPTAQVRTVPNAPDIVATLQATVAGNIIHLHLPHSEAAKLVPACVWDAQIAVAGTGATFTDTWLWTTDTTEAAEPGQLGMVGSSWASPTDFYVNVLDANEQNIESYLAQIKPGNTVRVEVVDDEFSSFGLSYGDYTVSAQPSRAGPSWWVIPVTLNTSHGAPPTVDDTPVTMTMPTATITTLVAGSVTVAGEVTMP